MKLVPVSVIPKTPGTITGPLNVVVPVPLCWTRASALMDEEAATVTLAAEAIVRLSRRFVAPTLPTKEMFPVPAFKVSPSVSAV